MAALTPLCPVVPVQPSPTRKAATPKKEKQVTRTPAATTKVKRRGGFVSDEEVRKGGGPVPAHAGSGAPPISIGIGVGIPIRGGSGVRHPSGPSGGSHAPVKSVPSHRW
jgi:hypothetical protein